MRTSAFQKLSRARNPAQARKCFTAAVRDLVWQLAQELEGQKLFRSAGVALELARHAAEATRSPRIAKDAAARAGFIASFSRYQFLQEIDAGLAGLRKSAEAFAAGVDIGRAITTFVIVSRLALKNGRQEQSLAAANRALHLLSANRVSNESLLQVYLLSGDIFMGGASSKHALFFAQANSAFKAGGNAQYATCSAALLGCTLIRIGDIESGLEVLADINRDLDRMALRNQDGGMQPVPEMFLAAYWTARGYALTGRLEEAERTFRDHSWLKPPNGNPELRDRIVSRIAETLIELERYNEALQLLNERLNGDEPPSVNGCALLLSQMAVLEALLGRPKLALDRQREVSEIIRKSAGADALLLRARFHQLEAGVVARAREAPDLQLELAGIEDDCVAYAGEIMPYEFDRLRGDFALLRGAADESKTHYLRALERAWSAPADRAWAEIYGPASDERSDVYRLLREGRTRARRRTRGVGLRIEFGLVQAKALLGEDPAPELDRVIGLAAGANRPSTLFYALYEKSKPLVARRDPAAFALLEQCADLLESLRSAIHDVSHQIGILADKERVYGDLLELAVASPAHAELAMRMIERAKGRGLIDEITAGSREPSLDDRDLAAHLRRRIVRLWRRHLAEGEDTGAEVRQTKQQLGSVFQRQYSRPGQPVAAVTPGEIAGISTTHTAFLHYFIDDRGAFACVAAAGRLHPPVLLAGATVTTVASLLDSFEFELRTRQTPRSLEELYTLLVEPVWATLDGASQLVVLPHRILHRVPFHALVSGAGRYLVEEFVLSYAPSASFALRTSASQQRDTGVAAPSVVVGVDRTNYLPLQVLGDVKQELTAVADQLDNFSVHGNEAGRSALLGLRGEIEVLHLACHGEFDQDDPLLSRLYMADGPVYAYELLAFAAHPRLIVLSACESGVGAIEAGDESFGLIRPLLTTGADAVLSSLWKISDRGAAAFMRLFYEQRRRFASDLPRCLAESQRAMVASPEFSHPYYWAPYIMVARKSVVS